MSGNNNEIVYEGWLTKSPPSRTIWKARWRRRWFVLRHSGELPGQFFLQYYKDRNRTKLKGTIDLDQCEQVDAGLKFQNDKYNYPHLFDVKTPKRTYFLAAETEVEMNKWVDCVCQVCGLKSSTDDTSVEFTEESNDTIISTNETSESATVAPTPSSPSSLYIPISECISGKPLNTPLGISDFNNIVTRQGMVGMDTNKITAKEPHPLMQNELNNIKRTICDDDISKCDNNKSVTLVMSMPKPSVARFNSLYGDKNILGNVYGKKDDAVVNRTKITNIESAKKMAELKNQSRRPPDLKLTQSVSLDFYDNPRKIVMDKSEWSPAPGKEPTAPLPNWDTFPNVCEEAYIQSEDIGPWSVAQRFGKLTLAEGKSPIVTNSLNRTTKQRAQLDTFSLRRPVAPPRPPKPTHLIQEDIHNYMNLENGCAESEKVDKVKSPDSPATSQTTVSDDMYDIPRSHQPPVEEAPSSARTLNRHNYLNAAPVEMTGNVFVYDFFEEEGTNIEGNADEPMSPKSIESGSGSRYSNLPSPAVIGITTPPVVNRELKPRKTSDSGSNEATPEGSPPHAKEQASPGSPLSPLATEVITNGPPNIDRTLKPKTLPTEVLKLSKPPEGSQSLRKVRAGPSPVPLTSSSSSATLPSNVRNGRLKSDASSADENSRLSPDSEPIYYFESGNNRYIPAGKKLTEIQYIDLDLESDITNGNAGGTAQPAGPTTTVYKTVDFLKTEAFNRTRQEVEEERNKLPVE